MTQFSILLFLSLSLQCVAQEEVDWFQPNQEWYYNTYCFQEYACGYLHYEVGENVNIGGEDAVALNRSLMEEYFNEPEEGIEYLRFENDTVWRFAQEAQQWHMLWDIGAEVGDVWTIQDDVFYGYTVGGEPEDVALFKVRVDSLAILADVPNSPFSDRRMVYTSPVVDEVEESLFGFEPILEGVGPVRNAPGLIGNETITALPLQSPFFQVFSGKQRVDVRFIR